MKKLAKSFAVLDKRAKQRFFVKNFCFNRGIGAKEGVTMRQYVTEQESIDSAE
ncbi:hypothetical protein [Legionella brunensis]|uniref:hypothetical protein n=1 Tax=Legionella brunensis TaxID=29422 RepID=UPI0012EE1DCD|nr:hypothetical protein [Legionella brunensis]